MNKYMYLLRKILYKYILKKDIMELKINYYRSMGVNIGNNTRTFSPLIASEPYLLSIGKNCTVSIGVNFITHDNSISKLYDEYTDVFGEVKIGDNVFIGANSIILPGVIIGSNTIIGAGSIVTKSFSMGDVIIGGNPARVICSVNDYKSKVEKYGLSTKKMTYSEKKQYLLTNKDRFIIK